MTEWVSVKRGEKSTLVTVTLRSGNLSVRWTVKTYTHRLAEAVAAARKGAAAALADVEGAV